MHRFVLLGGAVVLTMGLVGCASDSTNATSDAAPAMSDETTAQASPGVMADDSADTETPGGPVPVGTEVRVADWDVTVTNVNTNANKKIASISYYSGKPDGQYVLVEYKATYVGEERKSDVRTTLGWEFTGTDQVAYNPASVITPASSKNAPTEARPGGTVKLDVVFDVPKNRIDGGIISVEAYGFGSDDYADFTF